MKEDYWGLEARNRRRAANLKGNVNARKDSSGNTVMKSIRFTPWMLANVETCKKHGCAELTSIVDQGIRMLADQKEREAEARLSAETRSKTGARPHLRPRQSKTQR